MKVEKICCDRCGETMPYKTPRDRAWTTIITDTPISYFAENKDTALEKISEALQNNDMSITLRVKTVFTEKRQDFDLCRKCTKELNRFLFNDKKRSS